MSKSFISKTQAAKLRNGELREVYFVKVVNRKEISPGVEVFNALFLS